MAADQIDQLLYIDFLAMRKPREVQERTNPFETLDDDKFRARFRLKKTTVSRLLSEVGYFRYSTILLQSSHTHAITVINHSLRPCGRVFRSRGSCDHRLSCDPSPPHPLPASRRRSSANAALHSLVTCPLYFLLQTERNRSMM